ncbi:ferrochelatase [Advenella kashmirensis W13003]|uniref:Ferrochelatase n=1 Tax=Advenella kashmirensis W13003 TaxID=1424334 RepID=V8QLE7_9BURK|nr:ferrochelatase [Advenella kashmirensis]ETF00786.1 ferrochelatase [Advenella kashmirensis W13003]
MKTGVVLINLGTPASPKAGAIRAYLSEFLSDPRVVEIPSALWKVILNGAVLPLRPAKLAPKYKQIWMEEGSPLLVYGKRLARGVQEQLDQNQVQATVVLAMRYGEPSMQQAFDQLREAGCERILIVPLYPQFAASTTATIFERTLQLHRQARDMPEFRFVKRFHHLPGYLDTLASNVRAYWQSHGKPQQLLLSFHGLPQRSVDQGDPYLSDCMKTAEALQTRLAGEGVPIDIAFQSRFGRAQWLGPSTLSVLQAYPGDNVRHVDVLCPGFVADCLETLEEISIECARAFSQAGGEQFRYIPCLNDDPAWISAMAGLVRQHIAGWPEPNTD